jgi:rhodanese-related sulfurtransferase
MTTPLRALLKCTVIPAALLLAYSGTSCTKKSAQLSQVSTTEAQGLLSNRFAFVLDVREGSQSELKIQGLGSGLVIHIPFSDLKAGKLDALNSAISKSSVDPTLLIVGESAEQTTEAGQILVKSGLKAASLGSVSDMKKAGLLTQ